MTTEVKQFLKQTRKESVIKLTNDNFSHRDVYLLQQVIKSCDVLLDLLDMPINSESSTIK